MSISGARRVTKEQAMGEVEPGGTDPGAVDQSGPARMSPSYFPATIPADQFTRIREEARVASYANSQVERATVAAVDDAIFDRVRFSERQVIGRAERLLGTEATNSASFKPDPRRQPAMKIADQHLDELLAIRTELERGKTPVSELAERYKKVQTSIQNGDAARLLWLASETETVRKQLSDPIGHAERILSHMPLANWRPLNVGHW